MFAELAFAFVFREVQKPALAIDGGHLKRKAGKIFCSERPRMLTDWAAKKQQIRDRIWLK